MTIGYIRYAIPTERADECLAAYAPASSALNSSEHCLAYELSHGVEEPQNWILRIEWDSLEGHEHGFRSSPEFGPFFQAVRPFLGSRQAMKHHEATAVAGRAPSGGSRESVGRP